MSDPTLDTFDTSVADRLAAEALVVDGDGFEGPLDLLLTLGRTQKVDLRRISVLQLAQQYLAFVERPKALRPELAAGVAGVRGGSGSPARAGGGRGLRNGAAGTDPRSPTGRVGRSARRGRAGARARRRGGLAKGRGRRRDPVAAVGRTVGVAGAAQRCAKPRR